MGQSRRIRLGDNNVYMVDAAGARLLVDAGPDYRGAWEALQDELTAPPTRVLITHAHLDHAGLAGRWAAAGVPVAMHADDVHLAGRPQLSRPAEVEAMRRYAAWAGAPPEVLATAVAALDERRRWAVRAAATGGEYPDAGAARRWPTGLRYESFAPSETFTADTSYDGIDVLHCPGHTPGNVVAVDMREGWLFSGDQLLPGFTPTPAIQVAPGREADASDGWRFRSLPAFVASMRRLATLRLARCFPGHGEPFEAVTEAIEANLAAIDRRKERALREVRATGAPTAYQLALAMYPRALDRRFWQIIATVQGHLDLLEAEGAVRERDGRYEPT